MALQDGVQRASDIVGVAGDLAGLSESIGRHEDAIRAYEAALARTPNFVPYCNNLALLLVTYRTDKDSLRRAVDLSEKLAGMPGAAFLDTRGWVQLKAGDLPTAQTLLQQAANELPDEPAIRFHLAMAQAAAGDGPSARRNIVAALDSHREFPERAQAQQLLGRL